MRLPQPSNPTAGHKSLKTLTQNYKRTHVRIFVAESSVQLEVGQTRCPSRGVYGYLEYNSTDRINELDLYIRTWFHSKTMVLSKKKNM